MTFTVAGIDTESREVINAEREAHDAGRHSDLDRAPYGCTTCDEYQVIYHHEGLHADSPDPAGCSACHSERAEAVAS